ncbi:MAG TPA: ATP-binding cassette domain-containing protein [Steroidobacteraceae bacterium]
MKAYLEVRLQRIHVTRGERVVLCGIDWQIRPGQRWVLVGANGAGKTQLLKLIAGAVWPVPEQRPIRRYRWGREVRTTPYEAQDEIAYVGPERQDRYERYGWNHTVEQIIGTGIHRTDIPLHELSAADQRAIAALARRLGVTQLLSRRFLTLSYGERRLVLLARALASRPRLLLMDELLNGLDVTRHANALRFLAATRRSHLPWILSVHRPQDVPAGATHALILQEGRILYRGPLSRAPLARWFSRGTDLPLLSIAAHAAALRNASRARRSGARSRVLIRLTHANVYLDEHPALSGITLSIHRGECWVVHGPNGSGKSTFIRTLYGDHGVAAGGRIERAGIVAGVPLEIFKRKVGLVAPHLQADHPRDLTVAEVVQSGRHASIGLVEAPSAADRAAARAALAFFGMDGFGPRPLAELSYGQMRRVLFARAWVGKPPLLLLDEPYSGVDAPTRHALMRHLDELIAAGTTAVIATHNREEWPIGATHELALCKGSPVWCGPVRRHAR